MAKKVLKNESKELALTIIEAIEEKQGENIVVMDFTKMSNVVAKYFVVCHAQTPPQMEAITDFVVESTIKKLKSKPWKTEGFENKEWMLLDYVDVVVHVFRKENREFFNLDGLWADAIVNVSDL
ncbi:MAG: ribosome silencing factor [Bacteroidales bacterium]|nr:ribosome silencing factor [Bacteroidales bacterium]